MGFRATLFIGDYACWSSKDGVDHFMTELFIPSDKIVSWIPKQLVDFDDNDPEESEDELSVVYGCTIKEAIDRLEVRGYSLEAAKDAFYVDISEAARDSDLFWTLNEDEDVFDEVAAKQFLRDFTFERLRKGLQKMMRKHWSPTHFGDFDTFDSKISQYVLDFQFSFFGFGSPIHALRVLLEIPRDKSAFVSLDLSELVFAELVDEHDDIVKEKRHFIILTEGTTDRFVIERAMKLRYSHLASYYGYLEFDDAGLSGGAGSIVTVLKGLVAAGISEKVIAVFDNDSAATDALRSVPLLPRNFRIIRLPELQLAKSYPTIGPQGKRRANVNGRAVSIEMFLGENILRGENGLEPIVWTGYVKGVQAHQGEFQNKDELLKRFLAATVTKELVQLHDWRAMDRLLQQIIYAFRDTAL